MDSRADEPFWPEIPGELRRLMAEVGPRWSRNVSKNVALMIAEFSKVLTGAPKVRRVVRDIPYGSHERQRLDVYSPDHEAGARPALIFVHGGAFVEGRRDASAEIYANVLHYMARHGVVGINAGYRLAPEAIYPAAAQDVGAAVAHVVRHAGDYGIDPRAIFLMAHSAGAAHAATYAYDRRLQPDDGGQIAGLIVVSGRVRADAAPDNPNAAKVATYYGADASQYASMSAVSFVSEDSPETLIAYAEYENPLLDIYCIELAYRLAVAKRRAPLLLRLDGHNHTSAVAHINTADDRLGAAIRGFIGGLAAASSSNVE